MDNNDDLATYNRFLEFRKEYETSRQKSQESYDKTLITLSGGALGISFAFLTDVIGAGPVILSWILIASWLAWTVSLISTLVSFLFSTYAFQESVKQIDDSIKVGDYDSVYKLEMGGVYDKLTEICNISGGFFFVLGVVLIIVFVSVNFKESVP